jgi:hypothetical protein
MTNLDSFFVSTSPVRTFEALTFQTLQDFESAEQMHATDVVVFGERQAKFPFSSESAIKLTIP